MPAIMAWSKVSTMGDVVAILVAPPSGDTESSDVVAAPGDVGAAEPPHAASVTMSAARGNRERCIGELLCYWTTWRVDVMVTSPRDLHEAPLCAPSYDRNAPSGGQSGDLPCRVREEGSAHHAKRTEHPRVGVQFAPWPLSRVEKL